MVLARPPRDLARQERDRPGFRPRPSRLRAGARHGNGPGQPECEDQPEGRTAREHGHQLTPTIGRPVRSTGGKELMDRVLDVLHLDRLGEDDELVVGRELLLEIPLAGPEQHEGDELMLVLVGLLVHVDERIDGLGA